MSAEVIPSAILHFVGSGAYPEAEDVITADVRPSVLSTTLEQLRAERERVKQDIRSVSRTTAPDIDAWIAHAKALQNDILRSRDTARQIVAKHGEGRELKAKVEDAGSKVALLEKEVGFNVTLVEALNQFRSANGILAAAQDEAVNGRVERSLDRLSSANKSLASFENVQNTKSVALLHKRASQLKANLEEAVTKSWNVIFLVENKHKSVTINKQDPDAPENTVDSIVKAAETLGIFDKLLQKLTRDVERTIIKSMLSVQEDRMARIHVNDDTLSVTAQSDNVSSQSLFDDISTFADFLSTRLPKLARVPFSEKLVPVLVSRLERGWFEPSIPIEMSEMDEFEKTLSGIIKLADHFDHIEWSGSQHLRDWVSNAPRTWLTKRRELVLGDVRNLVFAGLRETKTVERVETEVLAEDDALTGPTETDEDNDEWGDAWEEPDTSQSSPVKAKPGQPQPESSTGPDEDETSAWDDEQSDAQENPQNEDGDEAWGWGDEEKGSVEKPNPNTATQRPSNKSDDSASSKPATREMTLRETYVVTAVPDGILEIIKRVISDAQTLSGQNLKASPIAPAAAGLYSLPTLAIAVYRATAPTAYAKLSTGNMLIYNDASRLSEQLRAWQASQPPASRLRLDNDANALDFFAKRAYSAEMESQRTILRDLLDGAQGFSNCTTPPFKAACEGAVDQTVDRLRDVFAEWKPTLPQSALLQSLGSLVAAVSGKIIGDIEDLGDISEADSQQLRALCERVTSVKGFFSQPSPDGNMSDMTFIYCPNWLKFQYLAEILESSLADIKYLWSEGELSLEFEAEEVTELIEALFAESDHRRKAIAEIRRNARR